MAIDIRDKRASAIGAFVIALLIMPVPDGVINQGDRQQVTWAYRGIAAGAAAADPKAIYLTQVGDTGPMISDLAESGPGFSGLLSTGPKIDLLETT